MNHEQIKLLKRTRKANLEQRNVAEHEVDTLRSPIMCLIVMRANHKKYDQWHAILLCLARCTADCTIVDN